MTQKNQDNFTIRYYKGFIRDLEAQLKDALARIKKLETKVKNIPITSPTGQSNMQMFSADDINNGVLPGDTVISGGGGGFTEEEIKAMIISWIDNGKILPIQKHDHTDDKKGGDAYANLGTALQ